MHTHTQDSPHMYTHFFFLFKPFEFYVELSPD
uniref:Uncharacterized protein n=1 Tax=Anguilla anguilla TaxID=7936 RepID=A0A0E9V3K6_ANGAN